MTTNKQYTEVPGSADQVAHQSPPSASQSDGAGAADDSALTQGRGEAVQEQRHSAPDDGTSTETTSTDTASTGTTLFAADDLSGLRARWDSVQAAFVDDPQQCVQMADGLVSDLVDQLTTGFADARARLEEQWARGAEVSTEDLRVALTHYREFFDRLLAV